MQTEYVVTAVKTRVYVAICMFPGIVNELPNLYFLFSFFGSQSQVESVNCPVENPL